MRTPAAEELRWTTTKGGRRGRASRRRKTPTAKIRRRPATRGCLCGGSPKAAASAPPRPRWGKIRKIFYGGMNRRSPPLPASPTEGRSAGCPSSLRRPASPGASLWPRSAVAKGGGGGYRRPLWEYRIRREGHRQRGVHCRRQRGVRRRYQRGVRLRYQRGVHPRPR